MLKAFWSTVLLVLSAAPAILIAQERYIVSYAGFGGFQAPVWAARDLGLFAKYGLHTDLVMIPGSARRTQALLGGSTHFAQIDGTALITAIHQGGDLVLISASLNKFPFSLVVQRDLSVFRSNFLFSATCVARRHAHRRGHDRPANARSQAGGEC